MAWDGIAIGKLSIIPLHKTFCALVCDTLVTLVVLLQHHIYVSVLISSNKICFTQPYVAPAMCERIDPPIFGRFVIFLSSRAQLTLQVKFRHRTPGLASSKLREISNDEVYVNACYCKLRQR